MTRFQTTRWSIVLQAREGTSEARAALEQLCRTYRTPVIAYVRRRGNCSAHDAEDLGQAFLTSFIEHATHSRADPARGSFRAFLLTALKHFLDDAGDRAGARKRGGHVQFESLDTADGAEGEGIEIASERDTPEQAFERAWAEAALRAAMRRLQAEAAAAGRAPLFERLSEFLIERPSDADYRRLAVELDMRSNTVAVSVHRLRRRLRELLHGELADTAADANGLQGEFDQLHRSLAAVVPAD